MNLRFRGNTVSSLRRLPHKRPTCSGNRTRETGFWASVLPLNYTASLSSGWQAFFSGGSYSPARSLPGSVWPVGTTAGTRTQNLAFVALDDSHFTTVIFVRPKLQGSNLPMFHSSPLTTESNRESYFPSSGVPRLEAYYLGYANLAPQGGLEPPYRSRRGTPG